VVVKHAYGRHVARSIHPKEARAAIRSAAKDVVAGASELRPHALDGPFTFEVDLRTSLAAELAALAPGTIRNGRTVRYEADDVREGFRCLLA